VADVVERPLAAHPPRDRHQADLAEAESSGERVKAPPSRQRTADEL
jgi:hypothetical protein